MTDKQSMSSQNTNQTIAQPGTVSRWIEDPFASVIAGIIIPAFAVALLLSAMAGLSGILSV